MRIRILNEFALFVLHTEHWVNTIWVKKNMEETLRNLSFCNIILRI